jgi:2-polyprenyl-3-methyl-5-hydroxy-6-metoxy-1,4-benzoquinol methylase
MLITQIITRKLPDQRNDSRGSDIDGNVVNKIYCNQGNSPLLALIGQHFSAQKGRVLDIGCGAGDNARLLGASGWYVTGITLSEQERAVAGNFCEEVFVHDLEHGLPSQLEKAKFDLVLMSHVLEHLRDPRPILAGVYDMLHPHGSIAVALPNVAHYAQRARLLRGSWRYSLDGIMDNTHFKFYTFETGAELLTDAGFEIAKAQTVGAFPWYLSRKIIAKSARQYIDRWACKTWPNLFGLEMQFIGKIGTRKSNPTASSIAETNET